jgi:hypothetical protein
LSEAYRHEAPIEHPPHDILQHAIALIGAAFVMYVVAGAGSGHLDD